MSNLYQTANLLGQLIIGRRPEWTEIDLMQVAGVSVKGAPHSASSGVSIQNSPKTRVVVDLREDVARYGTRVRVSTLDDDDTYTVTIDGMNFAYTAAADDETGILQGLADAINAGNNLGSLTLTFVNAEPPTVARGAGNWSDNQVAAGTQLVFTQIGQANDGLIVTVASAVTGTATLIATDEVSAEAGVAYNVTARQQVVASVEDRGGVPTLVIQTRIGLDQADTLDASPADDDAIVALLASEATEQTVAVSAAALGVLEFDQDATTCNVSVFFTARGANPPSGWRSPNELQFTGLTYIGFDERVHSGGCARCDVAISSADGVVRAFIGPAVQEENG